MKLSACLIPLLLGTATTCVQALTINSAGAWFEAAYVEWQPVSGAESYNVYYSGGGVTNQKLDNQLIRSYGSYLRADAVGLKPGSYTLRVAPVVSGSEGSSATTTNLTVMAHDRSGFAFSNGAMPGAYNSDGTPKSGAVVLYITENTKNTVSLDVTGATSNPCVGLQNILYGFKKGKDTRPLIIRLVGQITDPSVTDGGDIVIENDNNASSSITLEGIGEDATADGWGIRLKNANNVEIRNIGIMNVNSSEGDNIGLQQNNEHIWVHHSDFFYGDAGSDADQVKGDGALDCKLSNYVTFSYNHFWDNGKSNLLGLKEGTSPKRYITYHHNWYDHSDSRHPRVRYFSAHVYNNYYDGNAKYGAGSTLGSSIFMEANYFRNCKYPMLISMQGSDVWNESTSANDYTNMPTFSKEDGGIIKAYNNSMEGQHRFVAYGASGYTNSTTDFDAYVVTARNTQIPSTVKSVYGSNVYDNFDTDNSIMYSYSPDSPEAAKANVIAYAGRMNGGDFRWTFNNTADDTASAVNTALKSALTNYQTSLTAIQGDGNGNGGTISSSSGTTSSSSEGTSSSSNTPSSSSNTPSSSSDTPSSSSSNTSSSSSSAIAGDIVHNFTASGITSSYFTISGNLSTSKGTVNYDGLTLTQCLKLESATQISFTLDQSATLTLVFNADFTGSIKINGTSYTASAGIVEVSLQAGAYSITKGDASNLYYMSIVLDQTTRIAQFSQPSPIHFRLQPGTLSVSGDYRLREIGLFKADGSLYRRNVSQGNSLVLEGLQSGVYFVRVSTDNGVFHRTIFVEAP